MTMPSRGTRKVIVGDQMYRYRIRAAGEKAHLTVEMSNGVYKTLEVEGVLTPHDIATFIKEKLSEDAQTAD